MREAILSAAALVVMSAAAFGQGGEIMKGKSVSDKYCANCHGSTGRGNGPAAEILDRKPRDFARGAFMKTLSDEDLRKIICRGGVVVGKSSAMPPGKTLSKEDVTNVIAYIRSLAK